MFDQIYKRVLNSTNEAELIDFLRGKNIDLRSSQPPFLTVAGKLASEGQHKKVDFLYKGYQASLYEIVKGYTLQNANNERIRAYLDEGLISMVDIDCAFREVFKSKPAETCGQEGHFPDDDGIGAQQALGSYYGQHTYGRNQVNWIAPTQKTENPIPDKVLADKKGREFARLNNHEQVEKYRLHFHASPTAIAQGYVLAGNHSKVEEYRTQHDVSVITIILAYVQKGEHTEVDKYRLQNLLSVDEIAYIYVLAGNFVKVEEYCSQYNASNTASVSVMAKIYPYLGEHGRVNSCHLASEAVKAYVRAGDDSKVDEYREAKLVHVDFIAQLYAMAGNHKMTAKYRNSYKASLKSILEGYIYAGNHEVASVLVNRARNSEPNQYQVMINIIIAFYAKLGNHEKIDEYRIQHNLSVLVIAKYYALANDYEKVEEYRTQYKLPADNIVQWYAYSGNHRKVDEYRIQRGASIDLIAYVYARAGHHAKVLEYHQIHEVSLKPIFEGYIHVGNHDKVKEYFRTNNGAEAEFIVQCYRKAGDDTRADEYVSAAASSSRVEATGPKNSLCLTLFPPAPAPVPVLPGNTEKTHTNGKKSRNS